MPQERSRAYPATNLDQCIQDARTILSSLGKGPHDSDSIAKVLGYAGSNGITNRRVAAMTYFGILDRHPKVGYRISDLGQQLVRPLSQGEEKEALMAAFQRPSLFRELVEKFQPEGRLPSNLSLVLTRDHDIRREVAETAATVFIESAQRAGWLSDDLVISADVPLAAMPRIGTADDGTVSVSAPRDAGTAGSLNVASRMDPSAEVQKLEIGLSSGKRALLVVPRELVQKDIALLKKQIEFLELQIS